MVAADENKENAADNEPKFKCDKWDLVKDVNANDIVADIDRLEPQETELADCVVLIDGLPAVNAGDKLEKLKNVLGKLYRPFGENATAELPVDDEGKGKGYCFIEFDSAEDALACVAGLDGHKLDKKHKFKAAVLGTILNTEEPPAEWTSPETNDYHEPGNLWWWLEDKRCIDQYAVLYRDGHHLSILNNLTRGAELVCPTSSREDWTQHSIKWSPRGAYLATMHAQGIVLWGGENFTRLQRFSHNQVNDIDFSPDERFLVTYHAPQVQYMEHVVVENELRIWDVRSGDLLAGLPLGGPGGLRVDEWPFLKWSHDSKFVACRRQKDGQGTGITVYELPSCKPHKRMIQLPGVMNLQWSPTQPQLAYWVAEQEGRPASVSVLRVPSRDEKAEKDVIATKSPFNVVNAVLHWQPSGERLAVELTRYGKKKLMDKDGAPDEAPKFTNLTYNIQIFHMHGKDVPIDTIDLLLPDDEGKNDAPAAPVAFTWEPYGDRFCLLLGSERLSTPVFYSCKKNGKTVVEKTFEREQNLNRVQWSPHGHWCVLAGLRTEGSTGSGQIIFLDTSNNTVNKICKQEHPQCASLEFDPTGRYLVSCVSVWLSGERSSDYAYWMYTSQGRCFRKETPERMAHFVWRPRPPTCLSDAEIKDVKRNMKSHAESFAVTDKRDAGRASEEVMAKRKAMMSEWNGGMGEEEERQEAERVVRMALRGGVDTDEPMDDEQDYEEEVIEVLTSMDKMVIKEEVELLDP